MADPASLADELALASAFEPADAERWKSMVNAVLRRSGAVADDAEADAGERALTSHLDDVEVRPLYTADSAATIDRGLPGVAPFVRGRRVLGNKLGGWDIRQRHEDPDPRECRKAILADLEGGVSSLWLVVDDDHIKPRDLDDVLGDVYLDLAAIVLDPGAAAEEVADTYLQLLDDRGIDRAAADGAFGLDPLGTQARTGETQSVTARAALAQRLAGTAPNMRAFVVDALPYHEAGASEAEELGCALATGVAYLRAMDQVGFDLATAAAQLEFRYAATADQFLTIAKLRAARRLWASVTEHCGLVPEDRAQRQHASTSWSMTTQRDPWVNMLRTTTACFAAGAGGADAITVLPFDAAVGLPDAFGRRIARNTQSILIEESHTARVVDPAGGSWYVEALTDDLARAAWVWFQAIEADGGMASALDGGLVADRIGTTRARNQERLGRRQDALTGVSEFPLLSEEPLIRRPYPAVTTPAAGALPRRRTAEPYERLRDRSDAHVESTGALPDVAVVLVADGRAHSAVADFVTGALAPGGLTATRMTPGDDLNGRVVCVCAAPEDEAAAVTAIVEDARAAGAVHVLIAGRVGDDIAPDAPRLRRGVDLVGLLGEVLDRMAVA